SASPQGSRSTAARATRWSRCPRRRRALRCPLDRASAVLPHTCTASGSCSLYRRDEYTPWSGILSVLARYPENRREYNCADGTMTDPKTTRVNSPAFVGLGCNESHKVHRPPCTDRQIHFAAPLGFFLRQEASTCRLPRSR